MRQRQPQSLRHHLGGGGRTQELTAAAGSRTGAASYFCRVLERDLLVRKACANGLHAAGIFARFRKQGHASGHQNRGQIPHRRQSHHHRGQALVAGGDAHHSLSGRERADEPAKHDRGIVAVGKRIEHAGRALSSAIARIGAGAAEGDRAEGSQLARRFSHQQSNFPVTRMKAQRDRRSILGAQSAVGAQKKDFGAGQAVRAPAHAHIHAEAEQISRGLAEQHFGGDRQSSGGARGMSAHLLERHVAGFKDRVQ